MQIALIETFLDLMETRNFNRTAERLNITQSTVTHRINALEALFARKLFSRNKGGTQPTAAGLRFLDHAKALQHQWHEASRAVETAGAYERSMRLGLQHDLAAHYAGEWLAEVRRELPGTSIYLEVDYSNQMNRDLGAGDLDLAQRPAFLVALLVDLAIAPHFGDERFGQRVDGLYADAVQTAGDGVGAAAKLAAGVQVGHDDFERTDLLAGFVAKGGV